MTLFGCCIAFLCSFNPPTFAIGSGSIRKVVVNSLSDIVIVPALKKM